MLQNRFCVSHVELPALSTVNNQRKTITWASIRRQSTIAEEEFHSTMEDRIALLFSSRESDPGTGIDRPAFIGQASQQSAGGTVHVPVCVAKGISRSIW